MVYIYYWFGEILNDKSKIMFCLYILFIFPYIYTYINANILYINVEYTLILIFYKCLIVVHFGLFNKNSVLEKYFLIFFFIFLISC